MGRCDEAEQLYLQAMRIWRELLGEKHPDFATCLNNLALLHYRQGNYDIAESFIHQSIKIRRKSLGENHPDLVESIRVLASLYDLKGNRKASESLHKQLMTIRRSRVGKYNLEQLDRYPTLEYPKEIIINKEFDLVVRLLINPSGSRNDSITIEYYSLENRLPAIEIALLTPNFKCFNDNEINEVRIGNDDVETHFALIPFRIGKQKIRIDFFSHGRRLGTIQENIDVLGGYL